MIKILFVCHGNICRSPMAEFILKDITTKRGIADAFYIASAATSSEEIGNPIYPPAKAELARHGIRDRDYDIAAKTARKLRREDYDTFDYLLAMETYNIRNILRIIGTDHAHKVYRLLDFSDTPGDIADPWYTRRFDIAYKDIVTGCEAFLAHCFPQGNT